MYLQRVCVYKHKYANKFNNKLNNCFVFLSTSEFWLSRFELTHFVYFVL